MRNMRKITGRISKTLSGFDYMGCWGPFKTRDEFIGKPIMYDTGFGERIEIGTITDVDPDNDVWIAEIYI